MGSGVIEIACVVMQNQVRKMDLEADVLQLLEDVSIKSGQVVLDFRRNPEMEAGLNLCYKQRLRMCRVILKRALSGFRKYEGKRHHG